MAVSVAGPSDAARKNGTPPPTAQTSFTDHLSGFDTSRWMKADGWTNGSPFDNAWLAGHITFAAGLMDIRLDDQAALGEPYSSGNYQSTGFYGYGCYEASFRPVAGSGVVSSFFTYAGPFDNGGNGQHNEIDIEFLGYDTRFMQINFWTNGIGGHEAVVDLGFNAAQNLHHYGFKWTASGIEWYVDKVLVHAVQDSAAAPIPKAAESLQKIMMNVWPVDATASAWAGTFTDPGFPLHGVYDWVRYTAGENCVIADPPVPPPPPPPGDPSVMHVSNIAMSLSKRADQVIVRISVVNGNLEPVPNAVVQGAWSGVIAGGDTKRTTDQSGTATFYSSRNQSSGLVTFCVTNVALTGMGYDPGANAEACDSINK
jgi:beta-glucanase (GH16 family)